jgi:hypothetical protein
MAIYIMYFGSPRATTPTVFAINYRIFFLAGTEPLPYSVCNEFIFLGVCNTPLHFCRLNEELFNYSSISNSFTFIVSIYVPAISFFSSLYRNTFIFSSFIIFNFISLLSNKTFCSIFIPNGNVLFILS